MPRAGMSLTFDLCCKISPSFKTPYPQELLERKSSKIPKSFLVQMLGEDRVTKFVIQEILNSTMGDYARKENLDVKDRKISTTQTAEELKKSFTPGNEFGFNVIIEPENS
ncbi:hypothetical protein VNO77_36194 [Canavalia gladiata]|uniref:Trigger factor ribosome-binding bacterial domain-containing protein n=1 Tax=Canavalia gladiata TaxID=3824 RepID=A0AAN9K6Y0_CANGL